MISDFDSGVLRVREEVEAVVDKELLEQLSLEGGGIGDIDRLELLTTDGGILRFSTI